MTSKTICIVDHGNMIEFALKMRDFFDKVYYWSDWKGFLPDADSLQVGQGIEGVIRVENFWDKINDIDLFCFLDIYDSDVQKHLRSMGKLVWGVGGAEELELDRWKFAKWKHSVGLSMPETHRVIGMEKLEDELKLPEFEDSAFIKISKVRGAMETYHHSNWDMTHLFLDELSHTLGARRDIQEFVIESEIDANVEVGSDMWTVDGQFPTIASWGMEIKDLCYLGKAEPYESFPKPLKSVNKKLSDYFSKNGSRGFFSTEVRVGKDGVPFFIDPCMRCGSPTMEGEMEMYGNWDEILLAGASGEMVVPKVLHKYNVITMVHSEWAMENWMPIEFPESIRSQVKLRDFTVIKGKHYVVPHVKGWNRIGAVVGLGNTLKEAIDDCKKVAGQVSGFKIDISLDALDKANEEVQEAKKIGINF